MLTERGASRLLQAEAACCVGEWIADVLDTPVMPSKTLLGHTCGGRQMQEKIDSLTTCD